MCCILYIPEGVKTPSQNTLMLVNRANPHGIGFADAEGNSCKTLDPSAFLLAIKKRRKESACIIHFRLATHGSVSEKNCHPFYDPDTGVWFAHNGVLPIRSHDDMTDSEIFFRERFLPRLNEYGDTPELWDYVERERGSSRFVFMRGDRVVTLGTWHNYRGVLFSNLNWLY